VCTVEDVHYVADGSGDTRFIVFWWAAGCEFSEYERALSADPTVSGFREITDVGDQRLYRVSSRRIPAGQPLVYPFFRQHDVTELEARRTVEGMHIRARFPSRTTLKRFRRVGREIGGRVVVERLYTETAAGRETAVLTEKQRSALSLAAGRGYFETPAKVTLSELARDCEFSPQMLSRHLRSAVRKLVEREVPIETER
jgi:hypothetical protein